MIITARVPTEEELTLTLEEFLIKVGKEHNLRSFHVYVGESKRKLLVNLSGLVNMNDPELKGKPIYLLPKDH